MGTERNINQNPMPRFDLLPHPFRRVGHTLLEFCSLHLLSPISEHFTHPLDDTFDDEAYREHDLGHAVMAHEITAEAAYDRL